MNDAAVFLCLFFPFNLPASLSRRDVHTTRGLICICGCLSLFHPFVQIPNLGELYLVCLWSLCSDSPYAITASWTRTHDTPACFPGMQFRSLLQALSYSRIYILAILHCCFLILNTTVSCMTSEARISFSMLQYLNIINGAGQHHHDSQIKHRRKYHKSMPHVQS